MIHRTITSQVLTIALFCLSNNLIGSNQTIYAMTQVAKDFNDPKAQLILGRIYVLGQEVAVDLEKAEYWFKKAAAQNLADAQFELAQLYIRQTEPPNYDEAIRLLREAVKSEHYDAYYLLGELFLNGQGLAQDSTQAAHWLHKAALFNHKHAQFLLGILYMKGQGINQDLGKAQWWIGNAANGGMGDANYLFDKIVNVLTTDEQKDMARKWLNQATQEQDITEISMAQELTSLDSVDKSTTSAQTDAPAPSGAKTTPSKTDETVKSTNNFSKIIGLQRPLETEFSIQDQKLNKSPTMQDVFLEQSDKEEAEAQFKLAMRLLDGPSHTKNLIEAEKWLLKAAHQAHTRAQYRLGLLYEHDKKDFDKAVKWFQRAANQGLAAAQLHLGKVYEAIDGSENQAKAEHWLKLASAQGSRDTHVILRPLANTQPKSIPPTRAAVAHLEKYRQKAAQGNVDAQYQLGILYSVSQDISTPSNIDLAIKWLRSAGRNGHTRAQYELANLYRQGRGIKPNYPKAIYWYRQSAKQGDADAQYYMGVLVNLGLGIEKDPKIAAKWYRLASMQNHLKARYHLQGCTNCE